MKNKVNVVIFYGGGGNEHEVSVISKDYYKKSLSSFSNISLYEVEITKNKSWKIINTNGQTEEIYLSPSKSMCSVLDNKILINKIDYAIPCIHGYPGETGQLQGLFDLHGIPYFGNSLEASAMCMNKVTTKLWLQQLNVPIVEFKLISDVKCKHQKSEALAFFKLHKKIFVKASSEGSSVGVFLVQNENDLFTSIENAKKYSPYVLLEKCIEGREIEVSTYQLGDTIYASDPGEIHCPKGFYDYEEKYSAQSKTKTSVVAKNIDAELVAKIKNTCIRTFESLRLKDLARIDFFLDRSNNFFVNEINTFPGSTPISLFPLMMQQNGHQFSHFLYSAICKDLKILNEKVVST